MKTYPSYKDSSVEWIGDIPSGWRGSKLKYISNLFTGNSLNQNQKEQYESYDMSYIPYVSSKDIDVNYQTVNYNNGLRIPPIDNPLKICKTNGFLLCVEGGSSGRKMTYLNEDVCFVNKLCCFESNQNTKYQYYFIQTSNFQSRFKLSLTGLIGGVSISTLRNIEIPLPPLQEQQQISDYLDYKTKKIDTLIENTEQKIELLKEQRTSLINTTVTKGLNPNVEMKDSGVEWIGEIPSGWKIIRGKYLFGNRVDKNHPEEPLLSVTQKDSVVRRDELENKVWNPESDVSGYKLVKDGDFVISLRTFEGGIELSKIQGIVSPVYSTMYTKSIIGELYYKYLFKSVRFIVELNKITTGIRQGKNISYDDFSSIYIPLPNMNDQTKIGIYIYEKTIEIDYLIEKESKRIELLKEYRQSLISDVVTGKVDVRDEVLV